jgi:HD-GYP domain-containing protein (c-di-GMP phosphodiesterase class II)
LAKQIAEELGLATELVETANIAGSLMNFGKVLVSQEILTKNTALTSEELKTVHESILTSVDILSIIGFDIPVIPTLKQVLERQDGSGPHALRGESILITARVVIAANAFVALVSHRAHRAGHEPQKALDILQKDCDRLYDKAVVEALQRFLEKGAGRLAWLMPKKLEK